jgi:hypothetical protein
VSIGSEGYVSSYNYKNNDGFYKYGWGGLLLEYQILIEKFRPVIGLTLGGGSAHDLYTISGNYQDALPDQTVYKSYKNLVISPNLSFEYSFSDHIALTTKFDYNLYPANLYPDYIGNGLRMYVGVLFSR